MSNLRDTRRESAARRAFGASAIESRSGVVIETLRPSASPTQVEGTAMYTRSGYKPVPGKTLFEAVGGCGIISVRACPGQMRYATDVSDPAGATDRQRRGRIRSFFATWDAAEEQAAQLRAEGLVVRIVPARPYSGQPGDNA